MLRAKGQSHTCLTFRQFEKSEKILGTDKTHLAKCAGDGYHFFASNRGMHFVPILGSLYF
jgi:hypothetical protein